MELSVVLSLLWVSLPYLLQMTVAVELQHQAKAQMTTIIILMNMVYDAGNVVACADSNNNQIL